MDGLNLGKAGCFRRADASAPAKGLRFRAAGEPRKKHERENQPRSGTIHAVGPPHRPLSHDFAPKIFIKTRGFFGWVPARSARRCYIPKVGKGFPGAYVLRALCWAHVCIRGAAACGRRTSASSWPGSASPLASHGASRRLPGSSATRVCVCSSNCGVFCKSRNYADPLFRAVRAIMPVFLLDADSRIASEIGSH
jgi:hypothetical protein